MSDQWHYEQKGKSYIKVDTLYKIRTLESKLAAAQEEIDMMGIRYAAAEMHHGNNMQEVTEQRDRLAEAIEAASVLIAAKGRHNTMLAYNGLRDALQSLTQNANLSDRHE